MNNDYTNAIKTVIEADHETLQDVSANLASLKGAFDESRAKLAAILAGYDTITGPPMGARQTVMSIVSQLSMIDFTMQNVSANVDAALAAYTAAPTPPAPQS